MVTNPAHLGSTPEEALNTVLDLDELGFKVTCTTPRLPDPIQGLLHIMTFTGPRAERQQHIRQAMEHKALLGKGLGKPPYGYRIGPGGKLAEVPQEAQVVRLIFRLYVEETLGLRSIAQQLNQQGHHTRRERNWSMVTIRDMLRNRVYIGTYLRFGIRAAGNHTPLVSAETFRKAQDLMQSRRPKRRKGDSQPFLLSGLAYCAQCGNRMIGVSRKQTWNRKSGQSMQGTYRYYQCQSRTNQSVCGYHTWRARDLEHTVEDQVRQKLHEATPPKTETPAAGVTTVPDSPEVLERRKRLYMKYLRQAASGAIPLRRLKTLLSQLGPATSGPSTSPTAEPLTSVSDALTPAIILDDSAWETLDVAAKQRLLQHLVDRVEVSDTEAKVLPREQR